MRRLAAACGLLLMMGAASAHAQVFPSAAEPSRLTGQIAPMRQALPLPGPAAVAKGSAAVAPPGADKINLTLTRVNIDGATVYPAAVLESFYKGMLGKTVKLTAIYDLAARLTAKYRNDGYILSQVVVPPQSIDNGVVKLRVIEGYIDRVHLKGDTHGRDGYLLGFGAKIAAEKPLSAKTLERYMLLMNDLPGVQARAVLSPSATPEASDLTIEVMQKPVDVFVQADNRGSRFIGPGQATVGARLNNLLDLNEGINMQVATAPLNREMLFGNLAWLQPIDHEGTTVMVAGGVTSTDPGFSLAQFDIQGIARSLSVQVAHPFVRSRSLNVTGTAKFDYLNSFRSDNLGLGDTRDRLRVVRFAGNVQTTDSWLGADTANIEFSKGMNILDASERGDAGLTRALGDPQFFKVAGELTRLQPLNATFDFFASVAGQKSSDILLASEEFGIGGLNYGSAYDASEITGESGIALRTELRANNIIKTPAEFLQLYGFYDIGKVWDPDNAIVKDRQRSLADIGLGARASVTKKVSGTVEVAQPLTRDVSTLNSRNPRVFGAVTYRY